MVITVDRSSKVGGEDSLGSGQFLDLGAPGLGDGGEDLSGKEQFHTTVGSWWGWLVWSGWEFLLWILLSVLNGGVVCLSIGLVLGFGGIVSGNDGIVGRVGVDEQRGISILDCVLGLTSISLVPKGSTNGVWNAAQGIVLDVSGGELVCSLVKGGG